MSSSSPKSKFHSEKKHEQDQKSNQQHRRHSHDGDKPVEDKIRFSLVWNEEKVAVRAKRSKITIKEVGSKAHKSFAFRPEEYHVTISCRDNGDLVVINTDEDLRSLIVEKHVKELLIQFDDIVIPRHEYEKPFQSCPQLASNNGFSFFYFQFFYFWIEFHELESESIHL
jgi:hypothetical protein